MDLSQKCNEEENEEKLIISYEGKAFDNHEIDAKDLANAIFGLSSLLKTIHACYNGSDCDCTIEILPFQEGCFKLPSKIRIKRTIKTLFYRQNLITAILIQVISQKISSQINPPQSITNINNIFNEPASIYQSINRDLKNIIAPAAKKQGGIFLETEKEKIYLSPEKVQNLYHLPEEEPEAPSTTTTTWELLTEVVCFNKKKWEFFHSENNIRFPATIEDKIFLEKVQNNMEMFGAGDMLIVEMEIQKISHKTMYIIKKVKSHIHQSAFRF